MPKKIFINSTEEVLFDSLTEREKGIYNEGNKDGFDTCSVIVLIFYLVVGVGALLIFHK